MMTDNEPTHAIIGAAIEVHRVLGPGWLESAYEECLYKELQLRRLRAERQKPIPTIYKELKLECGYRPDLLVESRIIVEIEIRRSLLSPARSDRPHLLGLVRSPALLTD